MSNKDFTFLRETVTRKTIKGTDKVKYTRTIVYGINAGAYEGYATIFRKAEDFIEGDLNIFQLAEEQGFEKAYGELYIIKNGITFGDMPVWEMSFTTNVIFDVCDYDDYYDA